MPTGKYDESRELGDLWQIGRLSVQERVCGLIVCPLTEKNPGNTEADIVELKDGRLLLGYTEFYYYGGPDMFPARIAGKISEDKGRSCSEPFTMQENIGVENVMEGYRMPKMPLTSPNPLNQR